MHLRAVPNAKLCYLNHRECPAKDNKLMLSCTPNDGLYDDSGQCYSDVWHRPEAPHVFLSVVVKLYRMMVGDGLISARYRRSVTPDVRITILGNRPETNSVAGATLHWYKTCHHFAANYAFLNNPLNTSCPESTM